MDQMQQDVRERGLPVDCTSDAPTAIIVSDIVLYRQGLQASLVRDGRIAIADVVSGKDVLPSVARHSPDIVLLDAGSPQILALARTIRAHAPRTRVVGFGITGGADGVVECAEAGVTAFVDSSGSIHDLVEAALNALRGELSCSPQVSAMLCRRLADLAVIRRAAEPLTRREREIAALVSEGLSNKEIAKDLSIGPSTVKNHIHNILEKLRVRRRSGIAQHLHN